MPGIRAPSLWIRCIIYQQRWPCKCVATAHFWHNLVHIQHICYLLLYILSHEIQMVPVGGKKMNHPARIGLASTNEIFSVKEWSKCWVNYESVCSVWSNNVVLAIFCYNRKVLSGSQFLAAKTINKGQWKCDCLLSCRCVAAKHQSREIHEGTNVEWHFCLIHVKLSVIVIPSTVSYTIEGEQKV